MSDPTTRHLHAVPDDPTQDVPVGVTWEADPAETARYERVTQELRTPDDNEDQGVPESEPLPELEGRVYGSDEPDNALSPAKATAADVTERLKASLEAGHTYALLAWTRRWDVAMDYVMDPALRTEMLDEAERDLDRKRVRAAKKATRMLNPAEKAAAEREKQRLESRVVSELEVDARVLAARTKRLMGRCAIPAVVIVGPVLLAASGVWVGLLAWPAAWGWLAVQGRAHARAELGTATTTASPVEERARALVNAATTAAVAATVVGATDTENRILARLAKWDELAPKRGLDGITPGHPTLAETGMSVVLRTSGRLTPADLIKKTNPVRALLGVPTDIALDIIQGEQGDEALLRIRTRTPERNMTWRPGLDSIGVDVTTGQEVDLPVYHRMLIAGASRSGKTVLLRVLMAKVAQDPNACLVLIDAKRVEAARWKHVARTASSPQAISALTEELKHEMDDRYRMISATGDPLTPSPSRPRLVIVVDEGAEVIASDNKDLKIMSNLRSLAMMGGEAEMHLWWCTQKPTMTGAGAGIDNAIAGQMTGARVCLRVTTPTEGRTVLGEDANAAGWNPHALERAGLALVRDGARGPDPVAVWDMSSVDHIRALEPRDPWVSVARKEALADLAQDQEEREEFDHDVDVDEDQDDDDVETGEDWIGAQGAVMSALKASGPRTMAQLEKDLDYSKTMIYNALKQLQGAGRVDQVGGRGSAWRAL
ncbi:FtsK/SpoIIIE domain-containing protein [Nocardiopsis dassonvillei]|uniref:FtsK/SpoIIIE domain-containing protein n=1 Tax=Nocardiopsis dassonvillei TaxID=2014 RepID=UPI0033CE7A6D